MTATDELQARLTRAEWFIQSQGYRRCDNPACNCPYWHGGNANARLKEIDEALRESGCEWKGTILATLRALLNGMIQRGEAQLPFQKCDHAKTFHHRYLTGAQLDDMHERMNHEVSREEICKIADLLETRHLLITQRPLERESNPPVATPQPDEAVRVCPDCDISGCRHLRTLPAEVEPTEDDFLAALQSTINNHWETSISTPEIARKIRAALTAAGFTVGKAA